MSDKTNIDKLTLWERKLLDLSLRNNLLNTHFTRNTLHLVATDICRLEDILSEGNQFTILPGGEDTVDTTVDEDLRRHLLRTTLDKDELKRVLTFLYRKSRLSIEENGANSLYLTLGLLRWHDDSHAGQPHFAPILLTPIEIVRKAANKGYQIRSRDEETMVNVTMLEMLRQFFGISIDGLDPLPADGNGIDVAAVIDIFNRAIAEQDGWTVENEAMIGNFSFSKFIMWNDIHNNIAMLENSPIVSALMSGRPYNSSAVQTDTTDNLDEKYPVGKIMLPYDADSSQFEAICAAMGDGSFILHGPPGTGKSQTITNIIANALYCGKKVLFVAEKMAALQVVQHKLESIGLAPYCLELHSNKAKKSEVLEHLGITLDTTRHLPDSRFAIDAGNIDELRRELNGYIELLYKNQKAGFSLYDCFCRYIATGTADEPVSLSEETIAGLTPESKSMADTAVADYAAACRICGGPAGHPLTGIHVTVYSSSFRKEVAENLDAAVDMLAEYHQLASEISTMMGHDFTDISQKKSAHLKAIVDFLLKADETTVAVLRATRDRKYIELIEQAIATGRRFTASRDIILSDYDRRIFTSDIPAMEAAWLSSADRWWLPRVVARNKVKKKLKALAVSHVKPDDDGVATLFANYRECNSHRIELAGCDSFMLPLLGAGWMFADIDWQRLDDSLAQVKNLYRRMSILVPSIKECTAVSAAVISLFDGGVQTFHELGDRKLTRFLEVDSLVDQKCTQLRSILHTSSLTTSSNSHRHATLSRWLYNIDRLPEWTTYMMQRERVTALGYSEFVHAIENGQCDIEHITAFFDRSLYSSYASMIIDSEPALSSFHGLMYENKVERFRRMVESFTNLTKAELQSRLASSLPDANNEEQGAAVSLLRRNIRSRGRGTSLRRLFGQIPDLLTSLCPCMLMSPISVAQYLTPDSRLFDLVIFDEASQMPTGEAVGAIARGKNIIVVGDPKQMPPTDFFNRNTYDEDNAEIEDLESILDDCLALSMPSRHLLWHYRSRHESLISFSNSKYYNNRLLTFPSPDDLATKVGWQYVPGVYDRGVSRQNRAEAEAIIEEIRRRLTSSDGTHHSIGVVTFNINQQSLIEDLLTEMFRHNPELESIAMDCNEPIFIKNLENVQGDERDVILFSIGYGPDSEDRMALNFGPLNREGGQRRLNVAVSRARHEMKVFSSMRADDIELSRTSAPGVVDLKAFLEYAEKGRVAPGLGMNTSDALVVDIADSLRQLGYNVHNGVGTSGYRMDIAVVDARTPGRYLLGIQCDGADTKASRTARDRFVTQANVLGGLGWRLHHVRALDWWQNRQRTLKGIEDAIKAATV